MVKKVNSIEEYENIGKVKQITSKKTQMGGQDTERVTGGFEKSFWNGERYIINSGTSFIKVYRPSDSNNCPSLRDALDDNPKDIGQMMMIIWDMDKNNMVMYKDRHTHKGLPADKDLLYKMISDNKEVARRFVKRMMDKGIIKEAKIDSYSRYYINPIYTMADRGITLNLYKLFKEIIDPYLTDKAKEDLATLIYYEDNPSELARLQAAQTQQQEAEAEEFFDKLGSAEREQEIELQTALSKVEVPKTNILAVGSIESDCTFINSLLNDEDTYGKNKDSEYKTVVAINPAEMTREKRFFLLDAVREYAMHGDQDKLVRDTFGLIEKVKKETAMPASIAALN